MLILHDPRCADYGVPDHPERPARVLRSVPQLRRAHPEWIWRIPKEAPSDETLLLAHTPAHLRRLEEPLGFDSDTPYYPDIGAHARRSVGAAVEAARESLAGRGPSFSLMRPPGHHATSDAAMGFCYLNQAAIAALDAQRSGARKVAVWDFDAHHGNGTEAILRGRKDLLYCSVHQFPCYPGTGAGDSGNCRNWPVAPHAERSAHRTALRESWDAVVTFRPDLVLISAGFDAYARDPITQMTLEAEDFAELGRWIREGGIPASAVLEGGYSPDLPDLVDAFLSAWTGD